MRCGYLFHALNRNPADIRQTPHKVLLGDEYFNEASTGPPEQW